ncbi:MAG: hypothetical protein ACRDOO_29245 [Actinomadura sp.]
MREAVGPLTTALEGLADAKAYKGLGTRITAVEEAATEAATRLRRLTPPAELAAEHPRLVTALQGLHDELGGLGTQVDDREICTGAAVRARLGDADETADLREVLAAADAKLPGDRLAVTLPSARQKGGSRPASGKFVRSGSRSGRGTLTIDNGGSADAVVTLSRKGRSAVSVYIREGRKYTVKGVPDGTYTIFFTGGSDWDDAARAFGRDCAFQRFDESLRFRTEQTATQIRWSTWEITLHTVAGGNAETADVDPDDFPSG